jgi:hypothetical protein
MQKKTSVKQKGLTIEMKQNIIQASLQRSINELVEKRKLVIAKPSEYKALGRKISAYIQVKQNI